MRPQPSCLQRLQFGFALALGLCFSGCTTPLPTMPGFAMTLTPATRDSSPSDPPTCEPLRLRWLGTASFHISLDDVSLLTDPFYSNQSLWRTGFGTVATDVARVKRLLSPLAQPQAIFISHAHYDHIMDAVPAVRLNGWHGARFFGSETAGHLLNAYGEDGLWSFHQVVESEDWQPTGIEGVQFIAWQAEHAPQIGRHLLFRGAVTDPLPSPPTRAADFPVGTNYVYLLRIERGGREYRVFFAGTATSATPEMLTGLARKAPVDVAILSVPSWDKGRGYPDALIQAMRPRYIVPSHFNDLFADYDERRLLGAADLPGFLRFLQETTREMVGFEGVVVPDLGSAVPLSCRRN